MMHKKTIRIACLQLQARAYREQEANKENIMRFIRQAAQSKPDLMLLPECIYPCYFLSRNTVGQYTTLAHLTEQFLIEIKNCAREFQTFITVGFPEYSKKEDMLYNTALLVDDEGQEVGHMRKSFLWHFDHHWFKPDSHYPVFNTRIGRIGLFVCADGRLPEIIRCLALQGAEILLDLTNWVTGGLNRKAWSNPQAEYMIPVRALENKVWIVAANKVGYEEKSIQYCGKSAFFSPDGEIIAMASTDQEEILTKDVDLSQSHHKNIAGHIDIFAHRNPDTYQILTLPSSKLPVFENHKVRRIEKHPFAAVIQTGSASEQDSPEYLQKIEYFFRTLREQDVHIFSFSQNSRISMGQSLHILNVLESLTEDQPAICSIVLQEEENKRKYKTTYLVESGKIIGKSRKNHLEFQEMDKINPGEHKYEVFQTQFGRFGMMLDYEGYFPEIARILTLKGAQIIIWSCLFSHDEHIKICQSRSAENKIFIISPNASPPDGNGHSLITSPSGQIITGCLENSELASMTRISLHLADDKIIVPHTDAILGRQPESYQLLTSQEKYYF